ncbi:hypothetical protein [Desulfuribacillus stibiiarsenatis]|uniref:hypothetical protein n=1 Tax=Desulfuribacillus stibiiarsenatis TaxID=1390249 RepID=UPI00159F20D8|nr:hypothetical protein [Desulfuribacillus stibiiarsenatis]
MKNICSKQVWQVGLTMEQTYQAIVIEDNQDTGELIVRALAKSGIQTIHFCRY